MKTYEALYDYALALQSRWQANTGIAIAEYMPLAAMCAEITDTTDLPDIAALVHYANHVDDWNAKVVCQWPNQVITELEDSDKQYTYRAKGDDWEVYGVHLSGQEDWAGTVSTETLALGLVSILQ